MASIDLKGVRKVYPGNVTAIHSVDLSIEDGELVVLVGPSGCGKSTLLRMIAGLETITDGTISIGADVVNNKEPAERDIAMVFQNYALYPHMSVRQNLEYGLKNRGTPREEIDRRVAEAARVLEIAPFLDRKPRQLSGGQRQRVAMGRAIVRQPKAFLFDEPLSNLDAKLRGQMRIEIRRLQRSLKTTSVYVTHDQLEAMTLADRLVVMNGGRIEQVGKPIELYDRPASLFVAGFIGSPPMNLLPVETLAAVAGATMPTLTPGADIVGIRPDQVVLGGGDGIALSGTVELIEPVGGESHLYVRVEGIEQALILVQQGRANVGEAERIDFVLPIQALHGFNRESGRRVE
ncbi:sn-glycerol-3-phosphate import ATP-binding protein UgpC [Devosia sp. XJ19-1]|uniref:Sn-glycerol-3-phosphate import ATP-binding protein UgpC n=1 Tax=Devosia ureilytica TaxID=2952754 RepID=A0A9Q4AM12_9HYPH|nr:sn-glycerol-3-phosphate import ATP-binding protein UgpC [Devosia ureilytica]MCP8882031.1 sn-glycerol-3-phosphate import ATP-binding protein UgpC [Devosia ureilytica]MCP8886083.1 sn-glycerol-3-phosphate import ATP-binding protein UgpC [Devosia ureilytica]